MQNKNTGLVMEGGAMRGMFTCGVIDVLMQNNIEFPCVVGVSAGSAFGCNYKSKQIGRAIRYNCALAGNKNYCSLRSWIKTGNLFNAEFGYNTLPFKIDLFDTETFTSNPMEFYCVATDLNTGKPLYYKFTNGKDKDLLYMRASASMPLASRPVKVDGYTLLDGGMSDSIPLEFMQSKGYKKNVVILTQPRGFVKKRNSLIPLMKIALHKYPEVIKAMQNRHIMYNNETQHVFEEEKKGNVFVICPPAPLNISAMPKDIDELRRVYNTGVSVMQQQLSALVDFLKE